MTLTFYLKLKLALKKLLQGANETDGEGGLKVIVSMSPKGSFQTILSSQVYPQYNIKKLVLQSKVLTVFSVP